LKELRHFEDLGVEEKIILKWILNNWDEKEETGLIWLRIRTDGGLF
jgi:hypothetical protein